MQAAEELIYKRLNATRKPRGDHDPPPRLILGAKLTAVENHRDTKLKRASGPVAPAAGTLGCATLGRGVQRVKVAEPSVRPS